MNVEIEKDAASNSGRGKELISKIRERNFNRRVKGGKVENAYFLC